MAIGIRWKRGALLRVKAIEPAGNHFCRGELLDFPSATIPLPQQCVLMIDALPDGLVLRQRNIWGSCSAFSTMAQGAGSGGFSEV
jgi:hypothetical protein